MIKKYTEVLDDRVDETFGEHAELRFIEKIVWIMDDCITVPGTKAKFGLEPLLAFVPFAGDIIAYLVSSLMVMTMVRKGISQRLALKMIWNVTKDFVFGGIPIIGHFYDFAFKANRKNYNLLKEYRLEGKHDEGVDLKRIVLITLICLTAAMGISIFIMALLIASFWKWLLELF